MVFAENATVENVLATIGAIMWSVQILPQIWKSYKDKTTKGLSEYLMLIWFLASLFMGAYLVAQRLSIPLQIQPQAFGFFSAVSYAQCLYYGHGMAKWRVVGCFIGLCALFAGFQAGSVFALWAGEDRGTTWPILMYGYIGAVLLALGLAPQYWEIYKLREVIGISLFFLLVDIVGGVFSFLSLFFREELDIAAFVSYALVVVLDSIVIILAWILNPLARRRRAREGGFGIAEDPPAIDDATNGGIGFPSHETGTPLVASISAPLHSAGTHDRARGSTLDRAVSASAHGQFTWSLPSGPTASVSRVEPRRRARGDMESGADDGEK